jgi:hypothetical protein
MCGAPAKPRLIEFQNARPPEALTLPLNSQVVGTTRWQLAIGKATPIASVPERGAFHDLILQCGSL